ncbi:piggyBac transposable element-derived protein 4-like [Octopus sinensis]|uniref:PiggyBac transposable element-derived protein 4-like n=1 Tax=Octopus sinensis TaxID=2607531 RepID=A0A6P7S6Q5_9MOLL|nr:piggyBac transposable element-derived protein 4-like [Octopus sinensis]
MAESKASNWELVTPPEMMMLLGVKMLMDIVKKPEEEMYWGKDPLLETPIFANTMSYRRYKKIREYFHFTNNDSFDRETHPNPKLCKIYEIYQALEEKFQKFYNLGKNVTIDESLMLYKGRIAWF